MAHRNKNVESYFNWVNEQPRYRNIETNEIVQFGGSTFDVDTGKRGVMIFSDDDVAMDIPFAEFESKYVKVESPLEGTN
ncbi:hypothetical protein [Paenibacillus sp. HJGM_3]|uniref:hypothetical protein n=1 Tax=Paenibacillus sp. HJGM_3 TaxID=3379816 RepID=UPI00385C6F3C